MCDPAKEKCGGESCACSEAEARAAFDADQAVVNFRKGYNCAQSVFAAHAGRFGMDLNTALKVSAPLGGGVGRLREVCGAFSACAMLAGLKTASPEPDAENKKEVYEFVQKLAEIFKSENGSIICRELLKLGDDSKISATPDARTPEYYAARPCEKIVFNASRMAARL